MDDLRVGIAGFGAIGQALTTALLAGIPGMRLAAVATRRPTAPPAPGVTMADVAALLARPDLVELARGAGARILVPSGALLGRDAVLAAAEGTIRSARLVTRKPPAGLAAQSVLALLRKLRAPLAVGT